MTGRIYHLAEPGGWVAGTDEYRTSSLEAEGFIHCSTANQLEAVAHRLYRGRNDLTLLTIDAAPLGASLVFEDLDRSGQELPHVYGAIPETAVVRTGPYLKHLEADLWRPDARFNRGWMDRVLHPEFEEFGASGRHHSRRDTLDTPERHFRAQLPLADFTQALLSPDVALVQYVSRVEYSTVEERARRTSIWVNTETGWQLRFHQGTPIARD